MGLDSEIVFQLSEGNRYGILVCSALGLVAAVCGGILAFCVGRLGFDSFGAGVLLSVGAAAFLVNLHRLGFVGAAIPAHFAVAEVEAWRPSPVMGFVTAALGGLLAQVPGAWVAVYIYPEEFQERREALVQEFAASIAFTYEQRLAIVEEALIGLSAENGGAVGHLQSAGVGAPSTSSSISAGTKLPPAIDVRASTAKFNMLLQEHSAILMEGEAVLARDVTAFRRQVEELPMAAMRVSVAWNHPILMLFLTVPAMLLVGAPALLRAYRPSPMRAYARARMSDERSQMLAHHIVGEARAVASLVRWPTFSGRIGHRFADPPFNTRLIAPGLEGRPLSSERRQAISMAVQLVADGVEAAHGRGPRWQLVRVLLARRAAGGASDPLRASVDTWLIRELRALCSALPVQALEEDMARELSAAPVRVVRLCCTCTSCGTDAAPTDGECSLCSGLLYYTLRLDDLSVPVESVGATV